MNKAIMSIAPVPIKMEKFGLVAIDRRKNLNSWYILSPSIRILLSGEKKD